MALLNTRAATETHAPITRPNNPYNTPPIFAADTGSTRLMTIASSWKAPGSRLGQLGAKRSDLFRNARRNRPVDIEWQHSAAPVNSRRCLLHIPAASCRPVPRDLTEGPITADRETALTIQP